MRLKTKLKNYYFTAISSVIFAVVGFAYNAWRMEVTEDNNNIRTAAFEVLIVLAEFEQILYAAHYDKNTIEGSPRVGWVKIGLASDLSALISPEIEMEMEKLTDLWHSNWSSITEIQTSVERLVQSVTSARMKIKSTLKKLD
ncbi:MAG: hypothetical protein COA86_06985 [Kangiella sp.]|nr:MAG: hypothetical protein COA86_06985 [Kangiella sp.]